MKSRKLSLYGNTDNSGNMFITNKAEMKEFFSALPNAKFTLRIEVIQTKESSKALLGYYFNKIVPDFQKAYLHEMGERYLESVVEEKLRSFSPIMYLESVDSETGEYVHETRKVTDVDNKDLVSFIEHLRQIAAESFYFHIEDPNSYI